jgi:hypothetical protein
MEMKRDIYMKLDSRHLEHHFQGDIQNTSSNLAIILEIPKTHAWNKGSVGGRVLKQTRGSWQPSAVCYR